MPQTNNKWTGTDNSNQMTNEFQKSGEVCCDGNDSIDKAFVYFFGNVWNQVDALSMENVWKTVMDNMT